MAFSSKKLAALIIEELALDAEAEDLKGVIDTYMKTVKPRKARAKKDPNAPKRAKTAYLFFQQENRDKLKKDNPDATFGEISKLLGEKWKSLTDAKKKPFQTLADKDKKRAAQEKEKYSEKSESSDEEKPAPKGKGKAKAVVEEAEDESVDEPEKSDEPEEEVPQDEEPEEEAPKKTRTPPKKGAAKKGAAKGKGRGRGKK